MTVTALILSAEWNAPRGGRELLLFAEYADPARVCRVPRVLGAMTLWGPHVCGVWS